MIKNIRIFMMISLLLLLFSGCSSKEDLESGQALFKTTSPAPIEIGGKDEQKSIGYQVRKEVNNMDEIYDAAVIEGENQIVVVYKVKHLQRFKMKKIEKNLTKKLEDKFPEDEFIVSSDYKIFLEAIRLKKDLDDKNLSNEKAEKRFKNIIKLKKEMT